MQVCDERLVAGLQRETRLAVRFPHGDVAVGDQLERLACRIVPQLAFVATLIEPGLGFDQIDSGEFVDPSVAEDRIVYQLSSAPAAVARVPLRDAPYIGIEPRELLQESEPDMISYLSEGQRPRLRCDTASFIRWLSIILWKLKEKDKCLIVSMHKESLMWPDRQFPARQCAYHREIGR